MLELGHLLLVRHGESTWNGRRIIQGQNDQAQLTELGRQQARDVATSLMFSKVDAVISSDLQRALETAAYIAGELNVEVRVDETLRERSFGVVEGEPQTALTSAESGIDNAVVVDENAHPTHGESLAQLRARCGEFIERYREPARRERLVVVTHGGPIRALRAYCANEPMQNLAWDVVDNCSQWVVAL